MPPLSQSDQMRASGSGRRKVALPPGRSQLDWVRNSARLRQPRQRAVGAGELRKHRSRSDAWMAINGKVFDVSPYVEYHPGGIDMILAGAGKDGTKLFNKYHPWVNLDFMLARCVIGVLDPSDDSKESESESESEDDSTERKVTRTGTDGNESPEGARAGIRSEAELDTAQSTRNSDALRAAELE